MPDEHGGTPCPPLVKNKSLRERALGYLSRREHSRRELFQKLIPHAQNEAEVDALLDELSRRGWLSEARFTEQLIHARQGKFGFRRIAQELKEKGLADEAIASVLPELRASELETARSVWMKKFGAAPTDLKEKARQVRFMASRGFGQSVIWKVIGQQED
ncbi:MAG: recombination regulator RecX [Sulfuricellaceae bacterium]|nr:recombination regulator RecX [Sulfuricellaceae bacterium]